MPYVNPFNGELLPNVPGSKVNVPASGNLSGLTVEAQLQELDSEKVALANYIDWANPITYTPDSPYTLSVGKHYIFPDKSVPADYTVNFPTAVGNSGKFISVEVSSATNIITLDGNGSELIDNASTMQIWYRENPIFKSDGANWQRVGGKLIPMEVLVTNTPTTGKTSGAYSIVEFGTEVKDNGNVFNNLTYTITTKRPGLWELTFLGAAYAQSANMNSMATSIFKNGANPGAINLFTFNVAVNTILANATQILNGTTTIDVQSGDTLDGRIFVTAASGTWATSTCRLFAREKL